MIPYFYDECAVNTCRHCVEDADSIMDADATMAYRPGTPEPKPT